MTDPTPTTNGTATPAPVEGFQRPRGHAERSGSSLDPTGPSRVAGAVPTGLPGDQSTPMSPTGVHSAGTNAAGIVPAAGQTSSTTTAAAPRSKRSRTLSDVDALAQNDVGTSAKKPCPASRNSQQNVQRSAAVVSPETVPPTDEEPSVGHLKSRLDRAQLVRSVEILDGCLKHTRRYHSDDTQRLVNLEYRQALALSKLLTQFSETLELERILLYYHILIQCAEYVDISTHANEEMKLECAGFVIAAGRCMESRAESFKHDETEFVFQAMEGINNPRLVIERAKRIFESVPVDLGPIQRILRKLLELLNESTGTGDAAAAKFKQAYDELRKELSDTLKDLTGKTPNLGDGHERRWAAEERIGTSDEEPGDRERLDRWDPYGHKARLEAKKRIGTKDERPGDKELVERYDPWGHKARLEAKKRIGTKDERPGDKELVERYDPWGHKARRAAEEQEGERERKRVNLERIEAEREAERERKRVNLERIEAERETERERKRVNLERIEAERETERERKRVNLERIEAERETERVRKQAERVRKQAERGRKPAERNRKEAERQAEREALISRTVADLVKDRNVLDAYSLGELQLGQRMRKNGFRRGLNDIHTRRTIRERVTEAKRLEGFPLGFFHMLRFFHLDIPQGPMGVSLGKTPSGYCIVTSKSKNTSSLLQVGDVIMSLNGVELIHVDGGIGAWVKLIQDSSTTTRRVVVGRQTKRTEVR